MKTFVKLFALLWFSTISVHADLHASRSSSGSHSSAGSPRSSGGRVFLGHHHHPGLFFYGDFYDPYPFYDYYPGYYGYGPSYSPSGMGQAYSPSGPSYDELGRFWGKNLKHGTATRDQFVAFLQTDLLKASAAGRALFQGGFLKTYGKDGAPILNRALDDARATMPAISSTETPPKNHNTSRGPVIETPHETPSTTPPAGTQPKN